MRGTSMIQTIEGSFAITGQYTSPVGINTFFLHLDANGDVSVSYTHLTLPTICSV